MSPDLAVLLMVATVCVLGALVPFAVHRTWLLWSSHRVREPRYDSWDGPLPRVTVQLPIYNERTVVTRLIDAVCALDYPAALLDIQVLDDSIDDTRQRADARIQYWQARGLAIEHITRPTRAGYKAGALAYGTEQAHGEFLLILDADFVPGADLVHRLLGPFQDAGVGMVQARWDHLNEADNWLTRAQALLLDGHFFFEHGGRYAAHRFFNFNGTAGMWRRSCLEEAGGWRADTLTEDLDLSYRAQMAGWRFEFLPGVGVPAELPANVAALQVQQRRWAQGGIQTARKLLPDLMRGPWPARIKLEGAIHLLGHLAHPLTLLLGVLLFPSALARRSLGLTAWAWLDALAFGAATIPFLVFYTSAARRRARPWSVTVPSVLRTLALGVGLSAPVSLAVVRGFLPTHDPFQRTPKRGAHVKGEAAYPAHSDRNARWLGLALAGWAWGSIIGAVALGMWASLPFLALFAAGYTWVAGASGMKRFPEEQSVKRHPDGQPHEQRFRPAARALKGVEAPVG